jgi:SAM-dependent methyltransferase
MRTDQERFTDVWDNGDYRRGSTAQRLYPFLAQRIPAGATINDYGSGTGRVEVLLHAAGYTVNMVDIADNALEAEARTLIGDQLTYTVSPLESLPPEFPVADWGICINVLMLVPPENLHRILAEMRRTCRNVIIEVYDMDDNRLGEQWTRIKGNAVFWAAQVARHWPVVESVPSPEHPRRYITIGRSKI